MSELAARIRSTYPGSYDHVSDSDLESKWRAKHGESLEGLVDSHPSGPPTTKADYLALADSLPKGSAERENAINMATRMTEPEAAGNALAMTGALAAGGAAAPTVGRVLANPVVGGVMGAMEGYHRGGLPGALVGAAAGYGGGGMLGALGEKVKLLKFVARMGGAKGAAAAEELAKLATQAAPAAAEAAPAAATTAPMAARTAAAQLAPQAGAISEAQAAKTFAPGAESMKDIAAKVISWRKDMGLSKGQIASALQEHYKIPLSVGAKIANQVISSLE